MSANAYVHGIELHETDLAHHSSEVPHVDPTTRPRQCESLSAKCDPARSISRHRFHVFTIVTSSTLSE
jgi:hypothetical protein